MILTGSQAIKYHYPDFRDTSKSDTDYLVFSPTKSLDSDTEYLYAPCHEILRQWDNSILPANIIYTIKVSHMAWEGKNNKWVKHLRDIEFLKSKGCQIDDKIYREFYKNWEIQFGSKSHIKLNVSADKFFNGNVTRDFDHDYLHQYYKVGDSPAYVKILKDGCDVMISIDKFNNLSYNDKLLTCLEEMFVIASERNITLFEAYKKLITTMTKGEWNKFMIINSKELLCGFENERNIYNMKRRQLCNKVKTIIN